mgnify:CR=1 FL=1
MKYTPEPGLTLFCDHTPCDCQAAYCHMRTATIAAELLVACKEAYRKLHELEAHLPPLERDQDETATLLYITINKAEDK